MDRPDVVVVGNVGIDTNVYLASDAVLADVVREEGHFATDLDYVGQAGGFTSRGFARLGHPTAFIGHVGADPLGAWVTAELSADGVDLSAMGIDPAGTARSVNLMAADGSRVNFYDGRGHHNLVVDPALAAATFAGARLALFHLPDWARHLLPIARVAGAVIACDLQDMRDPGDAYRRDFVAAADILFVSAAHHADPAPLLGHLLAAGAARIVLCGRGADGVLVATDRGVQAYPPPDLPPGVELPVVDTNGAGDALAVGFLVAHVLQGRSIAEAVRRGQLGARWACAQRATSNDLITAGRLAALLGGPSE